MMGAQLEQMAMELQKDRLREAAHERLVREARRAGRAPGTARGLAALGRLALACAGLPARLARSSGAAGASGATGGPWRRKRSPAPVPAERAVAQTRRARGRALPVRVAAA